MKYSIIIIAESALNCLLTLSYMFSTFNISDFNILITIFSNASEQMNYLVKKFTSKNLEVESHLANFLNFMTVILDNS